MPVQATAGRRGHRSGAQPRVARSTSSNVVSPRAATARACSRSRWRPVAAAAAASGLLGPRRGAAHDGRDLQHLEDADAARGSRIRRSRGSPRRAAGWRRRATSRSSPSRAAGPRRGLVRARRTTGTARRTSRWATTSDSDEATRNGSTPMSTSRVSAATRVVGVQRGEHEVAGQRRPAGRARRSRCRGPRRRGRRRGPGAAPRAARGEGHARLRSSTGTWVMPGQLDLDRVLERDDVALGGDDLARWRRRACWSCRSRSGR